MSKLALIDGDTIAYRCAASCEPSKKRAQERGIPIEELEREPLDFAIGRADELVYRILNTTQAERHRLFLSGSSNFRKQLFPDYKANRARLVRPVHLENVREFLVREWRAEICDGYEADDGIGIAAQENTIICANDKDFRQLAGEHYNFVRDEFEVVDEDAAALNFFTQMLVGDTNDNVRGVDGIGPVKAGRLLHSCDPGEMYARVLAAYGDDGRFLLTYRLLRLLRSEEEYEELLENIQRESQGQAPTEVGSSEDIEMFSEPDTQ